MDPGRANNFNLIRLVLASAVIFAHCPEQLDGNRSRELLGRIFGQWISLGDLAVDGFFFVSGFLIATSWMRDSRFVPYLWRRITRIYPGYVVAGTISVFGFGAICSNPNYWSELQLRRFVFGLPRLRAILGPLGWPEQPYPPMNGPPWTIVYEFVCYLLVAGLGLLGIFSRRWWILALAVCLAIWSLAQNWQLVGPVPPGRLISQPDAEIPRLFSCFLAGSTFAAFGFHAGKLRWYWTTCAAVVLVASMFDSRPAALAIPWAGGYLLLDAAYGHMMPGTSLIRREDISYGIYLYAWPITAFIISRWPTINPWLLVAMTLVLTIPCGILSWMLVEKPADRFKGLFDRRFPRSQPPPEQG